MGKCICVILFLSVGIFPIVISLGIFKSNEPPILPDYFWGPKSKEGLPEDKTIYPYPINVDEKILKDLKIRLTLETSPEGNRLTPPLEGIGFEYGFNHDFLHNITEHWLNNYDWRSREKVFNKYQHFKTNIEGIDIHFLHVKTNGTKIYKAIRPLIILHGWPSSFVDFMKVIPMLTDPVNSDINFELILPSHPGFGFSERPYRPGMSTTQIGQIYVKLMKRLGHEKFYIHGGDWGSEIAKDMSSYFPKNIMGVHMSMCLSAHPRSAIRTMLSVIAPTLLADKEEAEKFQLPSAAFNIIEESGYFLQFMTKPDTVGAGLANSPSGLAAYLLEKVSSYTNLDWRSRSDGGLVPYYDLDDLLDFIMVYWVTNSITSSARLYKEVLTERLKDVTKDSVQVKVPTGCLAMPKDFFAAQSRWMMLDKFPQMVHYVKAEKGGHFPALEVPQIVGKDVIKFFNYLEKNQLAHFGNNFTTPVNNRRIRKNKDFHFSVYKFHPLWKGRN